MPEARDHKEEGDWNDRLDGEDEQSGLQEKINELSIRTTEKSSLPSRDDVEFSLVQSPTSLSASSTQSPVDEKSKWKTAWEESRHFVGGLMRHPYESTKHYSILRHSHGLVYYKGPTTSISITIFADQPIPTGRRLWLQNKGWSGNRGMQIKAVLRTNNNWIDVTPNAQVEVAALPETDERAWQRDIAHFLKKAPKNIQTHSIRETDVIRVPHEAQDGYYRVALTSADNRKALCASPVFRLASTSMSGSSIRGASLSTLPIELSIKAGSIIANTMASNAISPVTDSLRGQVDQYVPGYAQTISTTAYDMSGIPNKVDSLNEVCDQSRKDFFDLADGINAEAEDIRPPFPIKVRSKVVPGPGRGATELEFPTANLEISPSELPIRLMGTYFGWASPLTTKNNPTPEIWNPALITVAVCPYAAPSIAPRELIKVHMITSPSLSPPSTPTPPNQPPSPHPLSPQSTLKILILSPLHPSIPTTRSVLAPLLEAAKLNLGKRPGWDADSCLQTIRERKKARSLSERFVDARQAGQKRLDRLPVHQVGVRTAGAAWKDRMVGEGGMWVKRDGEEELKILKE